MRSVAVVLVAGIVVAVAGCSRQWEPASPPAAAPTVEVAPEPVRKIVFEGTIDLQVTDLGRADQKLRETVDAHGGFIAGSELRGAVGADREATWTVRVPSGMFREVLDALTVLGRVATLQTSSKDVTSEFYDTAARIGAKKIEEARLLEHISKSAQGLSEILTLEHEVDRVRGEIETMQARVNTLGHLADLATITVTMRELHPILPAAAPVFLERFVKAFSISASALRDTAEVVALVIGVLLPWATVASILGLIGRAAFLLWRRRSL